LFDHSDPTLQRRVVETYIRRLYQVSSYMSMTSLDLIQLNISIFFVT